MKKLTVLVLALSFAVFAGCKKEEGTAKPAEKKQEVKPEVKKDEPKPEVKPDEKKDALAASIKECDEYAAFVEKYATCDKVPAEAKDAAKKALETAKAGWATIAADGQAAAATACTKAAEALKTGGTGLGCKF